MNTPKKIAVLGGGVSSLTSVFNLTNEANWKEKYDITVYQLGWRLGGKCASGKNDKIGSRIEEHGLHLWFGFYKDAFKMMDECYKEYSKITGRPLTLKDAFTGYDSITLMDEFEGTTTPWIHHFPTNDLQPEDIRTPLAVIDNLIHYFQKMLKELRSLFDRFISEETKQEYKVDKVSFASKFEHSKIKEIIHGLPHDNLLELFIHSIESAIELFVIHDGDYSPLKNLLKNIVDAIWERVINKITSDAEARNIWYLAEFTARTMEGLFEDLILKNKGFDSLNHLDLKDWLREKGVSEMTVNSPLVRGIYGLVFGGKDQYTFEAGTAFQGFFSMFFEYHGHLYYRMNNGMGDIIIAPIYEVLKARGVKFEFFRKVTKVVPSSDGNSISEIHFDVQATLKPEFDIYEPLVELKSSQDIPFWPVMPRYEFLNEGEELKQREINLESYYNEWSPVGKITLTKDLDFDQIIFGISIGAIPFVAKDILDRPERQDWRDMVVNIKAIPTFAFQLWMKPTINELGWKFTNPNFIKDHPEYKNDLPLVGSMPEPFDTWAAMSHLIPKENWPENNKPGSIAYFCGPAPTPFAYQSTFDNHLFPDVQEGALKMFAIDFLNNYIQNIWPAIFSKNNKSFNWDDLIDIEERQGIERINSQYFRANIDPTERYVLSVTNSSKFRLKTKTSYTNLFITGDWIDIGFNAGCVEASVLAGKLTAEAVKKSISDPQEIEPLRKTITEKL